MNDNRPCTGFCNQRSYCVFLNDEFDECFNNDVHQRRSKLEQTLVHKCHKKFNGTVEEWQTLLDRIYREVCETYPCKYNVNKNEVIKFIDDKVEYCGYDPQQRADTASTMTFKEWNELLSKANKVK